MGQLSRIGAYDKDSCKRNGKDPGRQNPGFLPDDAVIRGDLLDYQWRLMVRTHLTRIFELS